jgi:hypothetical protein
MPNWIDEVVNEDSRVFHAGELEFSSARETDSGGRTVVFNLILTSAQQRMANPFSVATRRRAKKAGTRFRLSLVASNGPFKQGEQDWMDEVMLLAWADSPTRSTVTFLLPDDTSLPHPFMHCSKTDRWMAIFVELADDDTVVDQKAVAAAESRKGKQSLSQAAHVLLGNKEFQNWLIEHYGDLPDAAEQKMGTITPEKVLKYRCGIESKSELDTSETAAYTFRNIRAKFNERNKAR